jgi:hypothetical protein
LIGDVRDPGHLGIAGLGHPSCEGVLALTDDDEANLAVTMTAALLRARPAGGGADHLAGDRPADAGLRPAVRWRPGSRRGRGRTSYRRLGTASIGPLRPSTSCSTSTTNECRLLSLLAEAEVARAARTAARAGGKERTWKH